MSNGIEIGPNHVHFEDDFIAVRIIGFDPEKGRANVLIERKRKESYFYYVVVKFRSGDSTRIDYDGDNPNIPADYVVRTSHRGDAIASVEAIKVR